MSKKQLAQEYPPSNEAVYIEDLAERLKAKIIGDYPIGLMRRDAHPKMHGLVKAEFIVEPNLPKELRIGVFREPKTYQAWIRFSNQDARIQSDIARDIRGMAIKLMDVPGEKLLELEKQATTQDFILISTNVFVTKDVRQFDGLIKAMTSKSLLANLCFFGLHWRVIWNLFSSMKKFANPLQIRYFSTTPYLLGENAVKYSAIPHVSVADAIPDKPDDNFMRQAMINQLQHSDALFDFAVQLQTNANSMPIEDPGKAWDEKISPFRKVATIRILQQAFDSEAQRQFGENMSFSPWHSLPEHRPLGGINRARKVVYQVISIFRHQKNNVVRQEPTSWEIPAFQADHQADSVSG
jgi:hypothetical protein